MAIKKRGINLKYLSMLPGPTNVPNRVMRAMLAPIINHRSDDFVELYTDVVEKTQQVFETQNDIVALSASGTGAVEAGVVNLVKKGDKIIIPVNGEFSRRLSQLIEGQGGNVVKLETPPGENATFDQIKEAFDNNKDVKAFYVVHNETSTGTMVNHLDKVSDLTSRNDAFYVVDSVSLLGGAQLPVDKWNIDVCMTGAQKAIAAPPGISPISVSAKAKKYMIENPPSTMYFNLARYFKNYEEVKQMQDLKITNPIQRNKFSQIIGEIATKQRSEYLELALNHNTSSIPNNRSEEYDTNSFFNLSYTTHHNVVACQNEYHVNGDDDESGLVIETSESWNYFDNQNIQYTIANYLTTFPPKDNISDGFDIDKIKKYFFIRKQFREEFIRCLKYFLISLYYVQMARVVFYSISFSIFSQQFGGNRSLPLFLNSFL